MRGEVDLGGCKVLPGLIDIHIHGAVGADFSDGEETGLINMARYLAAQGITAFCPTSMTLPYETLERAYTMAARLAKSIQTGCARIAGIHMEGPFFSQKRLEHKIHPICGCQIFMRLKHCEERQMDCFGR